MSKSYSIVVIILFFLLLLSPGILNVNAQMQSPQPLRIDSIQTCNFDINQTYTGFPGNQMPFFQIVVSITKPEDFTENVTINNYPCRIETIVQPNLMLNYTNITTIITPEDGLNKAYMNTIVFNNPSSYKSACVNLAYYNNVVWVVFYPVPVVFQSVSDHLVFNSSTGNTIIVIASILIIIGLLLAFIRIREMKTRAPDNTGKDGKKAKAKGLAKKIVETVKPEKPVSLNVFIYVVCIFIVSRVVLTIIGIAATYYARHQSITGLADILNIWTQWDGWEYIYLSKLGYTVPIPPDYFIRISNFAWFPLYPLLMYVVSIIINNTQIAGLLISNACLFVACYYLYKLVALDADEKTGVRSVKYLFLFPTAFVFSAVLTESPFLMLCIMSFYYAKKTNWIAAGGLGFLAALTRPLGVYLLLPLAYMYFKKIDYRTEKIKLDAFALLLPVIGLLTYVIYCYSVTGYAAPFLYDESAGAGSAVIPLCQLITMLTNYNGYSVIFPDVFANGLLSLIAILTVVAFYKKIDTPLLFFGLLLILVPLSSPSCISSMTRYLAIVFPLFIICAKLGSNRKIDILITIAFIILQIIFMYAWVAHIPIIM